MVTMEGDFTLTDNDGRPFRFGVWVALFVERPGLRIAGVNLRPVGHVPEVEFGELGPSRVV
ncbi:hypothetical protein [Streptomyces sp. NPDC003077]|uniref:hypothetical protein n=1 Tax=Streptomyces sp. NPDC003077 TaxID=3154443 RepID=UPI0033BB8DA6